MQNAQSEIQDDVFVFPMSYAQEQLWLLDQLEPGNPIYNVPAAIRLRGPLDISAFEQSLNAIVLRHEILRTRFRLLNGQPVQIVYPAGSLHIPVIDLRQVRLQDQYAMQIAQEEARYVFHLALDLPIRTTLLQLQTEEHILLLTLHHIVTDEWSMGVLIRELTLLYTAFRSGQLSPLHDLPIHYADYAHWQRQLFAGDVFTDLLDFWKNHLKDAPTFLDLPSDRLRPVRQTFQGARYVQCFSRLLLTRLQALSQHEGVTLFMTLFTAFCIVLFRYTGSKDLLVGTPVANRPLSELENIIGFFANTVVLRTRPQPQMSCRTLLQQVYQTCIEAYAHQEFPFTKLVQELLPGRDESYAPLVQVMFSFQKLPLSSIEFEQLHAQLLQVQYQTSKFDLALQCSETEEGLLVTFEYVVDLFDEARIQRMAGHMQSVLEQMCNDLEQSLSTLTLLTRAEQRQVLEEWSNAELETTYDYSVPQLVKQQATQLPDAIAIVYKEQYLTYSALNEQANRLAVHLQTLGVGPEITVGVFMERSLELLVALLGILKTGGAYVPLDPAYPLERCNFMLLDAQVRVVITQSHLRDRIPSYPFALLDLDADGQGLQPLLEEASDQTARPDNLAYVIYTSGSTGFPKGVAITYKSLANLVAWHQQAFALSQDDRASQIASFGFDAAVWEIWPYLSIGASLHLVDEETSLSPHHLRDWLIEQGITLSFVPTPLAEYILTLDWPQLLALRALLTGGDRLQHFPPQDYSVALFNNYGPTENTVVTTSGRVTPEREEVRKPSLGYPIINVQVYILDEYMQPVPTGIPGELYVGGDGLARGYLHRPEQTAAVFIPHPFTQKPGSRLYKTGDCVRYLSDGRLEFLGRNDGQVKIRGFRIELGEIEAQLNTHPAISTTAAVVHHQSEGDMLIGYVVLKPDFSEPSMDEMRQFLRMRLPEYMIPAFFLYLPTLPLTRHGKIDRKNLPIPESLRGERHSSLPQNTIEEVITSIWSAVLNVDGIDIHDNFFALGGHSLLSIQVISRMREIFGINIPLRQIFETPTISALARAISSNSLASDVTNTPIERTAGENIPLSFSQQRLWFLEQLHPKNLDYLMPSAIRLRGHLDLESFEASLQEIVRRHDILRTTFITVEDQPIQCIATTLHIPLPMIDLTLQPEALRETEIQRLIVEATQQPFDLAHGPLLRTQLLQLAADDFILILTLHHIIFDGWSMGIFVSEMQELYQAFSQGQPSPLPELRIQYADYALWQRKWLSLDYMTTRLAYWQRQLDQQTVLQLPTDRPRVSGQTHIGTTATFLFPFSLQQALRALSQQEEVTLFMVLLAAFQVLLARYTGIHDISVGTPVANRTHSETENLIGFFVNTLVLRTDLTGSPSFKELLQRVRTVCLNAYMHQDVPFEKLVEEMHFERDLSHTPLFQVMLVLQNTPLRTLTLPGLEVSTLDVTGAGTKFELTLMLEESEQGLRCLAEYNTNLFNALTIERFVENYQTLLESIITQPDQKIEYLPILSLSQRQQLLALNETERLDYAYTSPIQMFEAQVEKTPEAIALVVAEQHLTYHILHTQSNRLARYLSSHGIQQETLVGIFMERSLELVVSVLAVLKAGGAYVPLDPTYPMERIRFVLDDAKLPVILTQQSLHQHLASIVATTEMTTASSMQQLLTVDTLLIEHVSTEPIVRERISEQLACVIYTSGSTGKPKGVMIKHRSICSLVLWCLRTYTPQQLERVLAATSLCFDVHIAELFIPLSGGGTIVLVPTILALTEMPAAAITYIIAVPSAVNELLNHQAVPASLLSVNLGGEPLTRSLVDQLQAYSPQLQIYNVYGPTEDTTFSTAALMKRDDRLTPSLGQAISNTQTYILDPAFQLVPIGVLGELYLAGDGLARGYLLRPDLTAERFVPNPYASVPGERLYKTGDMVRHRMDGTIEFVGRRDYQVKLRGYRIELGEIEMVLSRHQQVEEAALIVYQNEELSPRLVAYVVAAPGSTLLQTDLQQFLRDRLPAYMLPTQIVLLEKLPRTPNGKVDRMALPPPELHQFEQNRTKRGTYTPMQELLITLWGKLLNREEIDLTDDFFELGGHSLLITQLVSQLRKTLRKEVPLRWLFEASTIEHQAQRLESLMIAAPEERLPSLLPLSRIDPLPLSYAQQRLWFLQQLEPESPALNITSTVQLEGALQIQPLERAFTAIIQRHEIFRTSFDSIQGMPIQVIADRIDFALRTVDLQMCLEHEQGEIVQQVVRDEAHVPFLLTKAPLLRAVLLLLEPQRTILMLTMHHIVCDAWSMGILLQEITDFYQACITHQEAFLPELPLQYADFSIWQRQWLESEAAHTQRSYWLQYLQGYTPLQLPGDNRPSSAQTIQGAQHPFLLPTALVQELKKLSRRENMTLSMLMLAAFLTLLYRKSGHEDITIGCDIANRTHKELEGLIGFFINMLAIRINFSGNPSFQQILEQVRHVSLQAYAHQDFPFDKLVEALPAKRDRSYMPIFHVVFAYQNVPFETGQRELAGLKVTPLEIDTELVRFDFVLFLQERSNGIFGIANYNAALFKRQTIANIVEAFQVLLNTIVVQPENRVQELDMLTTDERRQLVLEREIHHEARTSMRKHARRKAVNLTRVDPQHQAQRAGHTAEGNQ